MNLNTLEYWLKSPEKIFMDLQSSVLDWENPERNRIFIDKDADVLFVAHIDTVLTPKYIRQRKTKSGIVKRIYAHGLDDRLGCLIAYGLSKELDADLLICDNEEMCRSTGQFHNLKDYNWIVEFDRAGGDVVTYDLDNVEFREALSKYWHIGIGAFSDISQLETLSCCMNIGIGYEFAHSRDSYVDVKTMRRQVARFRRFYEEYKDVKFVQDITYEEVGSAGECVLCNDAGICETVYGYQICRECFEVMMADYQYNLTGRYL